MAKVDLLPISIFAEGNESKDFELTFDEFASSESLGEMQEVKIFETNLINTFNEFRKININLKFETDNKKTEI